MVKWIEKKVGRKDGEWHKRQNLHDLVPAVLKSTHYLHVVPSGSLNYIMAEDLKFIHETTHISIKDARGVSKRIRTDFDDYVLIGW